MRGEKYPAKQDLNLAQKQRRKTQLRTVLPTALVLAVLIGLFCKFAVVDRLAARDRAQLAADQQESALAAVQDKTAGYDDVLAEYQSYSLSQQQLAGGADVLECLSLIQSQLLDKAQVSSFVLSNDTINAEISGVTLQEVSSIYAGLMASDLVSGVQVYTAATTGDQNTRVEASLTIRLVTADSGTADSDGTASGDAASGNTASGASSGGTAAAGEGAGA